ncbi:MAG: divalent-cation tolerance protein CutA [Erythrobacter sp.]
MTALIWCPFPDREAARAAANALLDLKLVGCANLVGPIESIFDWQGARETAEEIGVLFKTDAELLDRAIARLEQIHPYATPAIMGWRCDAAADSTRAWLSLLGEGGE